MKSVHTLVDSVARSCAQIVTGSGAGASDRSLVQTRAMTLDGSGQTLLESALLVRNEVLLGGPSVYEGAVYAGSDFFYTPAQLEVVLRDSLIGCEHLAGMPVRTRSKEAKTLVCEALGYVAPTSFTKTQPRLPHPNIDVYAQQSNNLQIWNQEVDSARRYIILVLDDVQMVTDVMVIAGADLAQFDTTGTLTSKFQASRRDETVGSQLVSATDTSAFISALAPSTGPLDLRSVSPVAQPSRGKVLNVEAIYNTLLPLVGERFRDPGATQERNRGTVVHRRACELLGLGKFADNGQFPDVLCQGLEVKLQLARTVDLGLELPNAATPVASLNGVLAVRDTRYAIFYGDREGDEFVLTTLVVSTGADFFNEFRQFGGKVSNSKLQLRLPSDWF